MVSCVSTRVALHQGDKAGPQLELPTDITLQQMSHIVNELLEVCAVLHARYASHHTFHVCMSTCSAEWRESSVRLLCQR